MKYRLTSHDTVVMPKDAKLLHVGAVGRGIYVWAQVYNEAEVAPRKLRIVATGEELSPEFLSAIHLGSVTLDADKPGVHLTYHIFDLGYVTEPAKHYPFEMRSLL